MSENTSAAAESDVVNELFKSDHGITQSRRKNRKAEAKCRLLLKRALKQGDIRFCNSCISSFANDGMLGLALVIVREVFEKGKFKPTEYSTLPLTSSIVLKLTTRQVHAVQRRQRVHPLQRNRPRTQPLAFSSSPRRHSQRGSPPLPSPPTQARVCL